MDTKYAHSVVSVQLGDLPDPDVHSPTLLLIKKLWSARLFPLNSYIVRAYASHLLQTYPLPCMGIDRYQQVHDNREKSKRRDV
jgi:hypothetical protein